MQFPNASANELGKRQVHATNMGIFSTKLGNSFKCKADTRVKMSSDVNPNDGMPATTAVLTFRNYHGQPFMTGGDPNKERDFGTGTTWTRNLQQFNKAWFLSSLKAVECIGDKLNTNKLIPIIIGSVLAALVLVILISYIVGRRKHRGNQAYQSV